MNKPGNIPTWVQRAGVVLFMVLIAVFIGSPDDSYQRHQALTSKDGSRESGAIKTGGEVVRQPVAQLPALPEPAEVEQFLAAQKLSPEEEHQLRLMDYQKYLQYKSRHDGKRDSELVKLDPHERKNVVRERLRKKLQQAMSNVQQQETPGS